PCSKVEATAGFKRVARRELQSRSTTLPHRPHWINPIAVRAIKKIPGKMLSLGWPMTNMRMSTAPATVHASTAKPTIAVHGINTSRPPRTSSTPVKYRNHTPAPICANNVTHCDPASDENFSIPKTTKNTTTPPRTTQSPIGLRGSLSGNKFRSTIREPRQALFIRVIRVQIHEMNRRPSAFHKNKSTCPCFDHAAFAGGVPHANGRLNSRSSGHGSAPREHTKRAAMAANRMLTAIAKMITTSRASVPDRMELVALCLQL